MTTHEQLLKLLAKNSAQSPMTFADLLAISGLQPATLTMVLDQMYAAHSINQATVTRSGIKQREVWPTGMAKQLNAYADPSKRVAPTPLPRRNEAPAIQHKEVTMNINHDEKTPKALTILKYIEANPVCKSAQISHATGIESPRSYIKAHISRGAVIVAGESRKDMKMQLAQGQTAEGIYGNGYNKAKPAAITETALPAFNLSAADDAQMPVFIIKRQAEKPDEAAASPKFDTDLGFYTDTEPKKQEPFFIGFAKSACTRKLKIAYTNQKTIILFGLSDNPIELNPEDTQELVNYCADLDHFVIQKRA